MTDIKRHSKGYWRSIYIFLPINSQYLARDKIIKELKKLKVETYSYQYYGKTLSVDPKRSEKAHITFRINFPDLSTYRLFLTFLGTIEWSYEDHNYDEPQWVKLAYVIGTKLAREILEVSSLPDISLDDNFLRLLFHGCFNNLHYSKKQELEIYRFLFNAMLIHVYDLAIKEIDKPT